MKKVLVVDDEKSIVKGLKFSLEQEDMEVDTAYDGEEAVEKARANSFDIILLDIMLPKHSGLEVCPTADLRAAIPRCDSCRQTSACARVISPEDTSCSNSQDERSYWPCDPRRN